MLDSPYLAEHCAILGKLYLYAGQESEAVQQLEVALATGVPDLLDFEARCHLISACWRTCNLDRAAEVCQQSCQRYPMEARFWESLGDTLAQKAQDLRAAIGNPDDVHRLYSESITALYRACALDPTGHPAHRSLVKQLAAARRTDEEREAVKRTIDLGLGIWETPLQRPEHWMPGLASRPWHDPKDFPWCGELERNFRHIRGELLAVLADPAVWPLVSPGELSLAGNTGDWREIVMLGRGSKRGRKLCPVTAGLLGQVPGARSLAKHPSGCGNAIFSKLDPGTHLQPHCGPTNTRLTCHLGVQVPSEGCAIRVGLETRGWQEGECIVFDDSWEHEVWNNSDRPRVVLLINFWHPGLPPGWHPDQLLCPAKYG